MRFCLKYKARMYFVKGVFFNFKDGFKNLHLNHRG